MIGSKHNRLTILNDLGVINRKRYCTAVCECGVIKNYIYDSVKYERTKSCGCLRVESNNKGHHRTHNLGHHPLHQVWGSIKKRCYNVKCKAYRNYGGKGVTVCDEWLNDFKCFYDWCISNGWQKDLQLDKDKLSPHKTGNLYSPEFCCFLTPKENMKYRSNSIIIEYKNEKRRLPDWCRVLGINYNLTFNRIKKGWDIEKSFEINSDYRFKNKLKPKLNV